MARRLLCGVMKLAVSVFGPGHGKAAGYGNTELGVAYEQWRRREALPVPLIFLDVRTAGEHAEAHIAGATLIPVQMLPSRLRELPRDRRIYIYCQAGWRSARAAALLASSGYTDIENIPGGIEAWQKAGYPVESESATPADRTKQTTHPRGYADEFSASVRAMDGPPKLTR